MHVAANAAGRTMADLPSIAGIVLAGGKSNRMGRNKALLPYKGRPLIDHMIDLLHDTGLQDIFISGHLPDYPGVLDDTPAAGPVEGIRSVIKHKPGYQGYLFVPVDMPLLTPQVLRLLLAQEQGGYFINAPLPAYLVPPFVPCASMSVQNFLDTQGICPVDLPDSLTNTMKNTNTPQEWNEVLSAS